MVPCVDVLGVRFPRLTRAAAVAALIDAVDRRLTIGVAFPDMSTLNIASRQPAFRSLLQRRVLTLNDGAGLAIVARFLRRRPFPDNLNGTDLCPDLLGRVPRGTTVFLLGAKPGVAERAEESLRGRFPHVSFVGHHHGYLDDQTEADVVATLRRLRPQIVFVGMGNPLQVELIDRHLDDPDLAGMTWLAVGGQLDYYGGDLVRAPRWIVRARLEWLYLVVRQPHKAGRYLLGIPRFLARSTWAEVRSRHDAPAGVVNQSATRLAGWGQTAIG